MGAQLFLCINDNLVMESVLFYIILLLNLFEKISKYSLHFFL